jgi:hypothetical protein
MFFNSNRCTGFVIVIFFLVLFVSQTSKVTSAVIRNWGWLALSGGIPGVQQGDCKRCDEAVNAFSSLLTKDFNEEVAQGMALALFLNGNTSDARKVWPSIHRPSRLLAVSDWLRNHGQANLALELLSEVNVHLERELPNVSARIGQICQHQFAEESIPAVRNVQSHNIICKEYWDKSMAGLIVDGQFDTGTLYFWSRHFSEGSEYSIDHVEGVPAPALKMHTSRKAYHGGIFQQFVLPKGTILKYSARLWIKPGADFRVLPLYVRYRQGGETKVSAGQPIVSRAGWLYVERSFTAFGADSDRYTFYPAFVRGIGEIWIDDVRLVPLDEGHHE